MPSKFHGFPWAFTYPDRPADLDIMEHGSAVRNWLKDNGLVDNKDYVTFDIHQPKKSAWENPWDDPVAIYCIAFKDPNKALMFKMAWA